MTKDFWLERWQKSEIGFHSNATNPWLMSHWPQFGIAKGALIFVPLCGKTLDILWLSDHGYTVLGVEISQLAVESFFKENNLKVTFESKGDFVHWKSKNIEIMCGDFFDLKKTHLTSISGVYDRAALIALPEDARKKYAAFLNTHLPPDAYVLLITLDYDQLEMSGPPFSVSHEEVVRLFAEFFHVQLLEEEDALEKNMKFKEHGLTQLTQRVYKLTR